VERLRLTETCTLVIGNGDLTRNDADAIVNAANEALAAGGGVCGAIFRAAGRDELAAACHAVPEVAPGVRCPTGEARITPGFALPARHVVHAVGPVYRSADDSAPLLRGAYAASLRLANEQGLRTVAFPAISCGIFGYPVDEAAALAVATCREHAGALREIRFVLFGADMYKRWRAAAAAVLA
jgi:O-acetyl-ADP-ribose deacetylase (regulator of RNase III)